MGSAVLPARAPQRDRGGLSCKEPQKNSAPAAAAAAVVAVVVVAVVVVVAASAAVAAVVAVVEAAAAVRSSMYQVGVGSRSGQYQ